MTEAEEGDSDGGAAWCQTAADSAGEMLSEVLGFYTYYNYERGALFSSDLCGNLMIRRSEDEEMH